MDQIKVPAEFCRACTIACAHSDESRLREGRGLEAQPESSQVAGRSRLGRATAAQAHGLEEFVRGHTLAIVAERYGGLRSAPSEIDPDVAGRGSDAVVDQVGNGRGQVVADARRDSTSDPASGSAGAKSSSSGRTVFSIRDVPATDSCTAPRHRGAKRGPCAGKTLKLQASTTSGAWLLPWRRRVLRGSRPRHQQSVGPALAALHSRPGGIVPSGHLRICSCRGKSGPALLRALSDFCIAKGRDGCSNGRLSYAGNDRPRRSAVQLDPESIGEQRLLDSLLGVLVVRQQQAGEMASFGEPFACGRMLTQRGSAADPTACGDVFRDLLRHRSWSRSVRLP